MNYSDEKWVKNFLVLFTRYMGRVDASYYLFLKDAAEACQEEMDTKVIWVRRKNIYVSCLWVALLKTKK